MDRDKKEIYTITVVRNFGVPLSFTIEKRKVALFAFLAAVVAGFLLFAALDYLVIRTQNHKVRNELAAAKDKLTELSKQVALMDQKYFSLGQQSTGRGLYKDSLLEQKTLDTGNLWDEAKGSLSVEELQEGIALEVTDLNAEVRGDQLHLNVSLVNRSNPDQPIGGYVCISLINSDAKPTSFKSVTGGALGDNGFPIAFKQGKQYFIQNRGAKREILMSLALKEADEYYTDAMVFVYSYKGTLLTRTSHSLSKAIFLE
ncbi:MAG: hypothetical protein A2600_11640 [Candidatus Lambdaproteobacteria bacterium RIFOXYD1_FULL_56_27]|uniref:Uncharacterized protein n=1 Tax=Candidatus Lambdaproteobacteria bacterium RIFOXYD2_FULL_56_26 TaxID=1817773 RepID=A0A1F6GYL9_9PROT|nr:MAG: hypothetical protein A2426_06270 [Candidatus Lambdaproteobacteria bacterium RIFOXYC1_FULL_56_13]OGH03248.1 MAG: hypothetical protein A2557_00815 [Candidatus Lambdaproteobacteria bacterium RIFOXYD2_FULL_56_26]OGH08185.1 MAG: hypothetical protein A2600_11640 [Candidatus Lambdaproteobacteria bacterium RIFOXYD1_FULL_56_27]